MRRHLLCAFLLAGCGMTVHGDEILLKNGNLISGTVVSEDGGTFVVEVDAGSAKVEMTIPRESVRTVRRSGQRTQAGGLPQAAPTENVFAAPPTGGVSGGAPGASGEQKGDDGLPPPLTTLNEPDFQDDDFIARAEQELIRLEGVLEEAEKAKAREIVRQLRENRADMEAGRISPQDATYMAKEVIPFRIYPDVENSKRAIRDVKEAMKEWREYRGATWSEKRNLVPELREEPGESGPVSTVTLVNEAETAVELELSPMENGAEKTTAMVGAGASGSVEIPNRKRYRMTVRQVYDNNFVGRLDYFSGGAWIERGTNYRIIARPEPEEE